MSDSYQVGVAGSSGECQTVTTVDLGPKVDECFSEFCQATTVAIQKFLKISAARGSV